MLEQLGYFGLFIGSFLASTIVPFSADALLIGSLVAGLDMFLCLVLATVGNWLGGLTSYAIGWLGNMERIEKWFKISPEKLEKQREVVSRWGSLLAFVTWLPFVGDVFSIALGFYKINWWRCALWMFVGRALRFVVWIILFENTNLL
ncbi:MAG: DedA family protein [Bacteroidales bacterium]|nr:DedA family protein [Bacteroidales bacterium]